MKIGIITVPFNNNYGGYLQSYALIHVLENMGHEVTLINRRPNKPSFIKRVNFTLKQCIKTILKNRAIPLTFEKLYRFKGYNMLRDFNKGISNQTDYIYTSTELKKVCENKFDACIVGSDQVWRAIYVPCIENYFLNFVTSTKKIAYAASFGSNKPEYTLEQIENCGKLIQQFSSISLREEDGIDVFRKFGWKYERVQTVLDPTMLLSQEDYENIIQNSIPLIKKDEYFAYILDQNGEIENLFSEIYKKKSIKPYNLYKDAQYNHTSLPSLGSWLKSIKDSPFIITDSYHGMVFSIIFNKPFVVYVNESRGSSRFRTILNKFHLIDRIYKKDVDINQLLGKPINWNEVNKIIQIEKMQSINFLMDSLSKTKK